MRIFFFDPPTSVAFGVPGVRIQLTDVSCGFGKLKSGFQLTDAGDFGRPRSQDFNLPTRSEGILYYNYLATNSPTSVTLDRGIS